MIPLKDAVIVVTGASSGLGRRFASDLAGAGAIVIGMARREDLLDELRERMVKVSPQSTTLVCDVSDTDCFAKELAGVEEKMDRIDVLINAAGVGEPSEPDGIESHRFVMATNYFAPVTGTLTVLPGMLRRGSGVIVNVSSDIARAPGPREVIYGSSKAALTAFIESLAYRTEGTGVHLHLLYPGWVPTAMGNAAVAAGMPTPPRSIRRTEEQVSRRLLAKMGGTSIDIDCAPVARMALVARGLFPKMFRRGVRRAVSG